MQLLAKDGVFLPTAPRDITQGLLASGNRADVLINCPAGEDFIFESRPFPSCNVTAGRCDNRRGPVCCGSVNGKLLHIRSVVNNTVPSQCDLPEFEGNRPCCD